MTWWRRATLSGLTEPISLSTPLCGILANPTTWGTWSTARLSSPRSTSLTTYLAIWNCLISARLICKGRVLVENNIAVADCWCLVTVCSRVEPFTCGYRSYLKDGERRLEILYMLYNTVHAANSSRLSYIVPERLVTELIIMNYWLIVNVIEFLYVRTRRCKLGKQWIISVSPLQTDTTERLRLNRPWANLYEKILF